MFGLIECDIMECNGVVYNLIPFFGFENNGWIIMKHDGTYSIIFHPIQSFNFHSSNLGCVQWNELICYILFSQIINYAQTMNEIFVPFRFTSFYSIMFHSFPSSFSPLIQFMRLTLGYPWVPIRYIIWDYSSQNILL